MKLNEEQKLKIIAHVNDTYNSYHELLKEWKDRMFEVDKACKTFTMQKTHSWNTSFKVNKAHEIENKIAPRIVSNKPRWLVTPASDEFDVGDVDLAPEEKMQKLGMYSEYSLAIGDYLNQVFQMDDIREVQKIGAKNLVRHGLNRRKVCYRYKIDREGKKVEEKEYDEVGNEVVTISKNVKESVVGEYPTVDTISWKDIYYDPRYIRLEDMPAVIDVKERIRLSYFTQHKDKFMDIDRLIDYVMCDYEADPHSYADRIYAITGIRCDLAGKVDRNTLNVKKYYGYFDIKNENGRDEKLYEFWVVNGSILVYADEITYIPYEDVKCFEDTETHLSTGFIEPILGLQDELNFKKNSASDYINQALNRAWIWSPNSGINPKQLIFGPGAIIPTTRSGEEALRNLVELPLRQLPPQYFQEQNDFERQIQSMSFTIDTSTNNSNEALTNTATGIKVRVFESNNVINQVRENFEASLTRLAYKLLHETYNNIDSNIIIKKSDGKGYWEMNKEAMRDAIRRYNIKIETGTSTYDGLEQKRADAIARWNLGQQASSAGVPVDLKELYIGIMTTFEGVNINKLVKPIKNPMEEQPMMGGVSGMPSPVPGMPGSPGVPKPKKMQLPVQQPLKNPQGIGGINGVSM